MTTYMQPGEPPDETPPVPDSVDDDPEEYALYTAAKVGGRLADNVCSADLYLALRGLHVALLLPEKQTISGWVHGGNQHVLLLMLPDEEYDPGNPTGIVVIPVERILALHIDYSEAGEEPLPWSVDARL